MKVNFDQGNIEVIVNDFFYYYSLFLFIIISVQTELSVTVIAEISVPS